jgi:hypothetical protein
MFNNRTATPDLNTDKQLKTQSSLSDHIEWMDRLTGGRPHSRSHLLK